MAERVKQSNFGQRFSQALENTVNYFRVSAQLHLPNLIISSTPIALAATGHTDSPLFGLALFATLCSTVACEAPEKLLNNLHRYNSMKVELARHGWDERRFKPVLDNESICHINAAMIAAIDMGFKKEAKAYYKQRDEPFYPLFFIR